MATSLDVTSLLCAANFTRVVLPRPVEVGCATFRNRPLFLCSAVILTHFLLFKNQHSFVGATELCTVH